MFAFRISTAQGIGHFMRCKWLALALQELSYEVCFLLNENPNIVQLVEALPWPVFTLPLLSEQQDAVKVLSLLETFEKPYQIIIDSYTLGLVWEKLIKAAGIDVIVIDDLAREHECDYLIDQKVVADIDSRYRNKLPAHCQSLLGPEFALLGPDYRQKIVKSDLRKNLLFSLGGGGDWRLLTPLIKKLIPQLDYDISVDIIIGPQAIYTTELLEFSKHHKQVEIICSPTSLFPYYQKARLFVGALGTSLYELLATRTPALTFSIASNQDNTQEDLQQLGHYFHVDNFLQLNSDRQIKLITTLLKNSNRVEGLINRSKYKIDGQGVSRVVYYLTQHKSEYISSPKLAKVNQIERKSIAASLSYRAVVDEDIMLYLCSRNKPSNAKKMTVTNTIELDEHINWWFKNHRNSYVIYENEQPIVFIWHQAFTMQKHDFLIGGWFTIGDHVAFPVALVILKWQLTFTKVELPGARWVAVINKENKFVRLLNQYMGFVDVTQKSLSYKAIKKAFPKASSNDFYYVDRDPGLQIK
ncbi:UDP-2,4-diacetamido-2,4,6-trideoxy-beta-L-altropyranose hydrolase [Nitrincola sp. MINF-07-Sa-05]|uniref:UDP-2,4-diacetamido-2,4, 6-trideoxy-beta-L-altropyranose hydrolase n=1 Tax=Nitrincola salilacus TaxID=3400273 RepID=UPI003917E085